MSLSKKISSGLAVCLVATLMSNSASADLVALKRDAGLVHLGNTGSFLGDTNLDPAFQTLGNADVQTTVVNDAFIWNTGNARWQNTGAKGNFGGSATPRTLLARFDFSALTGFSGAIINKAELRLAITGGNYDPAGTAATSSTPAKPSLGIGAISTHSWAEGNVSGLAYPGATPGVSVAHPSGTNTNAHQTSSGAAHTGHSDDKSWGTSSNSFFTFGGDVTATTPGTQSDTGGGRWFVYDVKSVVEDWADGSAPNYGFAAAQSNNAFNASEIGTNLQPVLFLDFTPVAVPEPSSFLMLSALTLGLGFSRKRKS